MAAIIFFLFVQNIWANDNAPQIENLECSPKKVQELIARAYQETNTIERTMAAHWQAMYGPKLKIEAEYLNKYLKPFFIQIDAEIEQIIQRMNSIPFSSKKSPEFKKLQQQKEKLQITKTYWIHTYGPKWMELPRTLRELKIFAADKIDQIGDLENKYREMLAEYEVHQSLRNPYREMGYQAHDLLANRMAHNRQKMLEEIEILKMIALKSRQLNEDSILANHLTQGIGLITGAAGAFLCGPIVYEGANAQNILSYGILAMGTVSAFCGKNKIDKALSLRFLSPENLNSELVEKWKKLESKLPPLSNQEVKKVRVATKDYLDNPPELQKEMPTITFPKEYSDEELMAAEEEINELLGIIPIPLINGG